MAPLTYLEFVAAFVAGPIAVLLAIGPGIAPRRRRTAVAGIAIMLFLALSYTTPWDNYLIARGAWWYGEGTVLFRVWNAPIEEYAFIVLQTLLASLWLYRRPLPLPDPPAAAPDGNDGADVRPASRIPEEGTDPVDCVGVTGGDATRADCVDTAPGPVCADGGIERPRRNAESPGGEASRIGDDPVRPGADRDPAVPGAPTVRDALLGAGAGAALTVAGVLLLSGPTYYLGAILAWGGPILGLQWAVGGSYLLTIPRYLLWAVVPPVVYLCAIDRLAIGWGIWTIAPELSTGLTVGGLPVEESTFFLVTTLMVVQGLVLFHWVVETHPYRSTSTEP